MEWRDAQRYVELRMWVVLPCALMAGEREVLPGAAAMAAVIQEVARGRQDMVGHQADNQWRTPVVPHYARSRRRSLLSVLPS
jgi:hypothetical protein